MPKSELISNEARAEIVVIPLTRASSTSLINTPDAQDVEALGGVEQVISPR